MIEEQSDSSRTAEDQEQPQEADGGDESSEEGDGQTDFERETQQAKEEVEKLEEDPPDKLEDWPSGKAKYETFGGPEGQHGYHEGPEQKLGPDSLRHRDDGSVEIAGEEAENPEELKGEPVPGGPTDPDTPNLRMDKAGPDDVSEIAQKASGKGEDSGDSEDEGEEGGERG
ncbi:MAG: hypothetical protein ABR581_06100 [Thermoleophilaceae bacterium]